MNQQSPTQPNTAFDEQLAQEIAKQEIFEKQQQSQVFGNASLDVKNSQDVKNSGMVASTSSYNPMAYPVPPINQGQLNYPANARTDDKLPPAALFFHILQSGPINWVIVANDGQTPLYNVQFQLAGPNSFSSEIVVRRWSLEGPVIGVIHVVDSKNMEISDPSGMTPLIHMKKKKISGKRAFVALNGKTYKWTANFWTRENRLMEYPEKKTVAFYIRGPDVLKMYTIGIFHGVDEKLHDSIVLSAIAMINRGDMSLF